MALGILQFVGAHGPARGIPRKVAVEPGDAYLLHLLARYFSKLAGRPIRFVEWTASGDPGIRAGLEGASLLGPRDLRVVSGAPEGWSSDLEPAWGTHVVVEEPGGVLFPEPYAYQDRKLVLRALTKLLDLPWTIPELVRVDWSTARAWTDFEGLLATGKLLDWGFAELRRAGASRVSADIFSLGRAGEWDSVQQLAERYGWTWLERHLEQFTTDVVRFHLAVRRGRKPNNVQLENRSRWEMEMVREAAEEMDLEQLASFARRIVKLAPVVERRCEDGIFLVLAGLDT
jgi:hypothetical protein